MSETYKRFPAVRCWIKHLLESKYNEEDKSHFTIFGKVKRVRLIATILEKREILNSEMTESSEFMDEDENSNMRIEFDLDDGTGMIRATLWRADPEDYKDLKKGVIVDITGLTRNWKGFVSISPEILKEVEDPNFKLLLDAEIIKRVKMGDIYEIPEYESEQIDNIPDEFDLDDLFDEEETIEEEDKVEQQIINIIKENSSSEEGIDLNRLKSLIDLSEKELKEILQKLEIKSKIYQSENGVYQTY
ncbi:MAG: OB-fold nucleic acid binding domain-containing protein [Candidatus Lokiarchaeota archaeon]